MAAAASRIADAVERREQIAIFGDYDVDGATSTAVLARSCARRARRDDPYSGPYIRGLWAERGGDRCARRGGATLAGDSRLRHDQHRAAGPRRRIWLDSVIIDHHQADEALPEAVAAIVNPNRLDDLSGLGHLAAVGLVFLVVIAANRELRRRGFWNADGASRR